MFFLRSQEFNLADKDRVTPTKETLPTTNYAILGSMPDGDIEALAFLVLMQAAKSAQEDLKSIMANVKALNNAKARKRELAAVAAFTIASALRPAAILAAPDHSLNAAHELCRWIEYIAKSGGDDCPDG